MRWRRLVLLAVLAACAGVLLRDPPASAGASSGTVTCQAVSTSSVDVLAYSSTRINWSIWTTSGAPTIYFREGSPAAARSANSGPLLGGQTYTQDAPSNNVYQGKVAAVTLSGTAWVCTIENKL